MGRRELRAGVARWHNHVMTAPLPLHNRIADCRLCAARFAQTATAHAPRPVVWFAPSARLLIAGQAPGARVHASGRPFTDPSGDRLRDWLGLDEAAFYDQSRVAIVPMAFCFPGYDAKGADLPPPAICARTWRSEAMASLPALRLTVLVGGAAMRWHLGQAGQHVTQTVADWRAHAALGIFPLPHPSWRNTAWIKRNPWFTDDVLPALRARVTAVMEE
jgi:uracil-DNA glycosylase